MPVTTASAATHITPVVFKTLYRHSKRKGAKTHTKDKSQRALDDIFYDEGFHIVKAFIELGTKNTVESLQAFTNTHIPAPFWCAVVPVRIPLSTCNRAADALIEWFGPEELKHVVGGERWWQIRGLDGIDSEWITEKDFYKDCPCPEGLHLTDNEKAIIRMQSLDKVMLYVHGGAFFWGSINTHRYQVIRYAKKIRGRAFTVNYRKAPQYPWPCPLQDVLAAYFYLTSPPLGAVHEPVSPSKLVFAGDSSGASLCLTVLTVLRDLGLPQPAGAVLISPWVDLTHSFPSVVLNSETDILPPHGFIHKPSPLWPAHPKPEGGYTRVVPTETKPPPQPGHADKLRPSAEQVSEQAKARLQQSLDRGEEVHANELQDDPNTVPSQKEMQAYNSVDAPAKAVPDSALESRRDSSSDISTDFWEPKPPKVLMEDPSSKPWELCAQIQLYATTEQLSHPLVSPVLQASLGNLCPLYILAGNGECLRDEIVYLAHKAAHPKAYPARQGILRDGHRQKENAEKFQTPTKVHLQVFDDMCHVLTVFTFTDAGKYAYRSIARFVKHVIENPDEDLQREPFPDLSMPHPHVSSSGLNSSSQRVNLQEKKHPCLLRLVSCCTRSNCAAHALSDPGKEKERNETSSDHTQPPAAVSVVEDFSTSVFVRERVDPLGRVRPMEHHSQIEALQLRPQEIGIIKERPVRRWLAGQEAWDKKFRHEAERVLRRRTRYEAKAARLLEHAREKGPFHDGTARSQRSRLSADEVFPADLIHPDRRWGPLDLKDERPPPSAIAGRRDTKEAVALLKRTIYHSAPITHVRVPKMKTSDIVRAALDLHDRAAAAAPQSVSEEQVHTRIVPVHGLRIWQYMVEAFVRKSSKAMEDGKRHGKSGLRTTKNKVVGTSF